MADWVAYRVVERLGAGTFQDERERAMQAVARDLPALRGSDHARLGPAPRQAVDEVAEPERVHAGGHGQHQER